MLSPVTSQSICAQSCTGSPILMLVSAWKARNCSFSFAALGPSAVSLDHLCLCSESPPVGSVHQEIHRNPSVLIPNTMDRPWRTAQRLPFTGQASTVPPGGPYSIFGQRSTRPKSQGVSAAMCVATHSNLWVCLFREKSSAMCQRHCGIFRRGHHLEVSKRHRPAAPRWGIPSPHIPLCLLATVVRWKVTAAENRCSNACWRNARQAHQHWLLRWCRPRKM